MVVAGPPNTKEAFAQSGSWVDVRDTALAHVLALEKDEAGGQRIITSSGALHANQTYPLRVIQLYFLIQGVMFGKNGVCLKIQLIFKINSFDS